MGIIRDIYETFYKKDNPESVAQEVAELYKEKKENGAEHPIDATVEMLIQKIKENPDPNKVKELLIAIIEENKIPDRVFEKTSAKLLKEEEIPNTVITQVVKESGEEIQDESIDKIIEEGNIEVNQRIELIKSVNDRDILQKHVEKELQILYTVSNEKKDSEIVERIEVLERAIRISSNTQIQYLIQRIIAKKMAENYYNDYRKGTKIYTLSKVIPVEEMIKIDLPSIVLDEYRKIEEKNGEKSNRINVSELRMQILDKVARNIIDKYRKTGVYLIPQSESMKRLTQEEEQKFINSIKTFSDDELTEKDILNIKEQIHGNTIKIKENQLISLIKELPEKDKMESIDFVSTVLQNNDTLNTILMLKDSGLLEYFSNMPQSKRKKSIEAIGRVVENRKYRISKNIPKINDNSKLKVYKEKIEQEKQDR